MPVQEEADVFILELGIEIATRERLVSMLLPYNSQVNFDYERYMTYQAASGTCASASRFNFVSNSNRDK